MKTGARSSFERSASGDADIEVKLHRGNARAIVEDAAVADDDDPGLANDLIEGEEFGSQLRTDAGGITHRKRYNRSHQDLPGLSAVNCFVRSSWLYLRPRHHPADRSPDHRHQ